MLESDVAVQHSPKRAGSGSPYNLCLLLLISLHTASCYLLLAAINLSPDSGTSKSGAVVTSLLSPCLWPEPKHLQFLFLWLQIHGGDALLYPPRCLLPHRDSLHSVDFFSPLFVSQVPACVQYHFLMSPFIKGLQVSADGFISG